MYYHEADTLSLFRLVFCCFLSAKQFSATLDLRHLQQNTTGVEFLSQTIDGKGN